MSGNYVIAISGGSGSGKTTLAKKLSAFFSKASGININGQVLGKISEKILGQDSYYIDQSKRFDKDGGSVNFDHPKALEFSLFGKQVQQLKNNLQVEVPIYDFATHKRVEQTEAFPPERIIIVEGTLLFSQPELLPLFDEMIFLEVSEETRFERRLKRDTEERGRTRDGVFSQFYSQVKPMHDQFVEPSKNAASIILRDSKMIVSNRRASQIRNEVIDALNKILSGKS